MRRTLRSWWSLEIITFLIWRTIIFSTLPVDCLFFLFFNLMKQSCRCFKWFKICDKAAKCKGRCLKDAFVKGDVAVHWCSLGLVRTSMQTRPRLHLQSWSGPHLDALSSWKALGLVVVSVARRRLDRSAKVSRRSVLSFPHRRELAAGGSSRTHTQQQEWWRSECSLCFCSRSSVRVRVPKSWTHQSDLQGRWKKTFLVQMDDGPWSSWHTRGLGFNTPSIVISHHYDNGLWQPWQEPGFTVAGP